MFQEFKIDNLEQFPQELDKLLNQQRTTIQSITQSSDASYEKVLKPLQDLDEELGLFFTPLSHLNSVMNSDETQKAYEESLPLLSKFSSEIAQNDHQRRTVNTSPEKRLIPQLDHPDAVKTARQQQRQQGKQQ